MNAKFTAVPILGLVGALGAGCNPRGGGTTGHPLTQTELFNLRSRCADIARKIGADIAAETPNRVSHYDQESGHCYVTLTWRTSKQLYDAQSGELLAYVGYEPNKKHFGQIFMTGWRDLARRRGIPNPGEYPVENSIPESDFVTVSGFIDAVMKEQR